MEDQGERSTIHYATTDMNEEGNKAHNGASLTKPDLVCKQDPLAVGQLGDWVVIV